MKFFKTGIFIAALTLAVLSQSACTKNEEATQGQGKNKAGKRKADRKPITLAEAEEKVLKRYPEGHLISAEMEWDEGKKFYEIEAKTAALVYEVTVNAETGQVLETEDNTLKFRADSLQGKAPMWKVEIAERNAAQEAALQAYPGALQQWKAVSDSGRAAFAFKIKNDAGETKKVVVQNGTNKVLKIKF